MPEASGFTGVWNVVVLGFKFQGDLVTLNPKPARVHVLGFHYLSFGLMGIRVE